VPKVIKQLRIQKAVVASTSPKTGAEHLRNQQNSAPLPIFKPIPKILQLRKLSGTSGAAAGSTAPQPQGNLHSVK
jgi:hypothetical protein